MAELGKRVATIYITKLVIDTEAKWWRQMGVRPDFMAKLPKDRVCGTLEDVKDSAVHILQQALINGGAPLETIFQDRWHAFIDAERKDGYAEWSIIADIGSQAVDFSADIHEINSDAHRWKEVRFVQMN